MIVCSKCGLEDIVDYVKNMDEVYLEFLARFDSGQTPDKKEMNLQLKENGIVRDTKEIEMMIGNASPDAITREILFSKNDYVSYYKTIKEPEPKLGLPVDEMGLSEGIAKYLQEKKITNFYK